MRFALAGAALLLNAMVNLTTFRCLTDPIAGVYEANPVARWTFDWIGLLPGLLIETALSTVAISFLAFSTMLSLRLRIGILAIWSVASGWAVQNNLGVMQAIGRTLLG